MYRWMTSFCTCLALDRKPEPSCHTGLLARRGLGGAWIDPDARSLERHVLAATGHGTPERLGESDGFETPLLPGLVIALAEVFAV
jgi:hypothetical protein